MLEKQAARSLGLVSLGIGLTEIAAPQQLERVLGVNGQTAGILRVLGVREIMHGVDILSHRDPTPGVWSRVAGDVLDGVLLGLAARRSRNRSGFMAVCAAVLPVVLLDMAIAPRLSAKKREA